MIDLNELKNNLLEDPDTRREYDTQAPEIAIARQTIAAGLSQDGTTENPTN